MTPEETIEDIRALHGEKDRIKLKIAEDDEVSRFVDAQRDDLNNALKELSAGLYSKDTHFLLELIQNADDNRYENGVIPTIHFIVRDNSVLVNCNEKGFTDADVRALCRIGASTKKPRSVGGYIGEKGIGFKAVFKAANRVYVRSPDWQFLFDISGDEASERGMLLPVWTEFLGPIILDSTQFLLLLKPETACEDIINRLFNMDPTLLLFLQKLKSIKIDVPHGSIIFDCERGNESTTASLRSRVKQPRKKWTDSTKEYLRVEETLGELPREDRRPDTKETQILLAFPIQDELPVVENQLVYAFLPIKDFGFQFLIQADFLTTSNREDVLDCAWNRALLSGVASTFAKAIDKMNSLPGLKHTWPEYLASLSGDTMSKTHLSHLAGKNGLICKALAKKAILWDRAERLKKPTELLWVPSRFATRDDVPLLDNFSGLTVLSPEYPKSCDQVLTWLGVTELEDDLFLQRLGQLSQSTLKSKSQSWHKDLAKCLNGMGPERLAEMDDIALIPLRDGAWISGKVAKESGVYFDSDDLKLAAPTGTDLKLVHKNSAADEDRKKLFKKLGVTACTPMIVCASILEYHENTDTPPLAAKILIEHAIYIYTYKDFIRTSAKSSKGFGCLWLADSRHSCAREDDLYVDVPGSSFALSKVLHDSNDAFPFLHPGYLNPPGISLKSARMAFLSWLQEAPLGVRNIPRLAVKTLNGDGSDGVRPKAQISVTAEFHQIIATNPSSTFLHMLIKNWEYYYRKAEVRLSVKANSKIVKDLSCQHVDSSAGKMPLNETVLRTSKLSHVAKDLGVENVPWLDIDMDALDEKQGLVGIVLKVFGVCVQPCARFYLILLKDLKSQASISEGLVKTFFFKLSKFLVAASDAEGEIVKSEFNRYPMIQAKCAFGNLSWVTAKQCVWRGPPTLRSKFVLQNIYPDCQPLFFRVLDLEDATFGTLVGDLQSLIKEPLSENLINSVKSILLDLPAYKQLTLKDECKTSGLLELTPAEFLPVHQPDTDIVNLQPIGGDFYIADDVHLKNLFEARVPLLDFEIDQIRPLRGLLEALGLKKKFLSVAHGKQSVMSNDSDEDANLTQEFRRKAANLYRCFLHYRDNDTTLDARRKRRTDKSILWHLEHLYVFRTSSFKIRYKLDSLADNQCPESDVDVYLEMFDRKLYLYVPFNEEKLAQARSYSLPRQIRDYLGLVGADAEVAVSNIILYSERASASILDDLGVEKLPTEILDELQSRFEVDEQAKNEEVEGQASASMKMWDTGILE